MTGELLAPLIEGALEKGALDAWFTPIIMKKGRPATKISLLTAVNEEEKLKKFLFFESSTLGIRRYPVEREALERKFVKKDTSFGEITFKQAFYEGKFLKEKVEFEECLKIAKEKKIPVKEVIEKIRKNSNNH